MSMAIMSIHRVWHKSWYDPFLSYEQCTPCQSIIMGVAGLEEYLQPVRLRSSHVGNLSVIQMYNQVKC